MASRCFDEQSLTSWLHKEFPAKNQSTIEEHLESCASCKMLLDEIRFFEGGLSQALRCPEPEDMARWLEGRLQLNKARKIQDHISECEDCREMTEVVEAALDEDLVQKPRKAKVKRGHTRGVRAIRRRSSTPAWLYVVAPLAAAALIMFLLSPGANRSDSAGEVAGAGQKPEVKVSAKNKEPGAAEQKTTAPEKDPGSQPRAPTAKDPERDSKKSPVQTPKQKAAPEMKSPDRKSGDPGEAHKTSPSQPKVMPKAEMKLASGGGALAIKRAGSKTWTRLSGDAQLDSDDVLMAQGDHAHFTFSKVEISLRSGSAIALKSQSSKESRIRLENGEALFSIQEKIPGHKFIAMAGKTETTALGTRFLVKKGSSVTVFVDVGEVSFACPRGQVQVGAGQASRGNGSSAPKAAYRTDRKAMLRWSEEALQRRVEREGLIYPQGFLAARACQSLVSDLNAPSAAVRARALHAFYALRSRPEYCSTVDQIVEKRDLAKVRDGLLSLEETALTSQSAAADLLHAMIYEAFARCQHKRSSLKSLERKDPRLSSAIARIADAIASAIRNSKGSGGIDAQRLLALKLAALTGRPKLGRDFWSLVASKNVRNQGNITLTEHITLLLLPRQWSKNKKLVKNARQRLRAARLALNESLTKDTDKLHQLQETWVLEGLASSSRDQLSALFKRAVLEDLKLVDSDRVLLVSRALQALLLGVKKQRSTGPRILIRGGQAVISFRFKARTHQKQVFLCGSWSNWNETKTPMRRQKDGRFAVLMKLPLARHEYKFRMGDKDKHWLTDPLHKLVVDDSKGGLNSLLDLR
jgi:ferric-dicitrate binding protein FerR (iron transport regulator)